MGNTERIVQMVNVFSLLEGRQPRVLISGKGKGVPGLGAAKLAGRFADLGFNVDFGPLCSKAEDLFRYAEENDADIICLTMTNATDPTYLSQVCALSEQMGPETQSLMLERVTAAKSAQSFEQMDCFILFEEESFLFKLQQLLLHMTAP